MVKNEVNLTGCKITKHFCSYESSSMYERIEALKMCTLENISWCKTTKRLAMFSQLFFSMINKTSVNYINKIYKVLHIPKSVSKMSLIQKYTVFIVYNQSISLLTLICILFK